MRELRVRGRAENRERGWMSFRSTLCWRTQSGDWGMQLSGGTCGERGNSLCKGPQVECTWGVWGHSKEGPVAGEERAGSGE